MMLVQLLRRASIATVLVGTTLSGTSRLGAQPHSVQDEVQKARRVPVTVALVDTLAEAGATAQIVRRAHGHPRDLILIRRSAATGGQLAAAIQMLLLAREVQGDTTHQDLIVRVPSTQAPRSWSTGLTRQTDDAMAKLRTTPPHPLAGVGLASTTVLHLRPNALAGKAKRGRG